MKRNLCYLEQLMSFYRDFNCNTLNLKQLNQRVKISGWVDTIRDHGNLLFIDLRDNYGVTQCVIDKNNKSVTIII